MHGRLSCLTTVHLFAPLKFLDNRVRKYKRCSFSCGMEKYSTCPRNKVFAFWLYQQEYINWLYILDNHLSQRMLMWVYIWPRFISV